MERIHLILSGKVQGVGFRYHCQYQALLNNVTGWVKNLNNGDVELEAQGTKDNIDKFITSIFKGNGFSKIANSSLEKLSIINNEKKFKIT